MGCLAMCCQYCTLDDMFLLRAWAQLPCSAVGVAVQLPSQREWLPQQALSVRSAFRLTRGPPLPWCLQLGRDKTGATVINQYVVVKTLGRGAFGKVKLCLNTVDNQLYAIKVGGCHDAASRHPSMRCTLLPTGMPCLAWCLHPHACHRHPALTFRSALPHPPQMINRSHLLKSLQRPRGNLRRRASTSMAQGPTSDAAAAAAVAAAALGGRSSFAQGEQQRNPLEEVIREIAIMKKMDHPNVVKLYEVSLKWL